MANMILTSGIDYGVVPIDNYDQPLQPYDWPDYPEWVWWTDEGGYDD